MSKRVLLWFCFFVHHASTFLPPFSRSTLSNPNYIPPHLSTHSTTTTHPYPLTHPPLSQARPTHPPSCLKQEPHELPPPAINISLHQPFLLPSSFPTYLLLQRRKHPLSSILAPQVHILPPIIEWKSTPKPPPTSFHLPTHPPLIKVGAAKRLSSVFPGQEVLYSLDVGLGCG